MGASGGGASGKVGYPAYVEVCHGNWLNHTGGVVDNITSSVTDVMNAALGNSPYTALVPYDPDADIATYLASISTLEALVAAFIGNLSLTVPTVTLPGYVSESDITADMAAHEAQLESLKDNRLTGTVLPRFEAGMRDIGAVISSAFVIGRAIIEADADAEITREVARHGSQLRVSMKPTDAQVGELNLREAAIEQKNQELILSARNVELEFQKVVSHLVVEAHRIKIVAKKEEADLDAEYDVADAKWDLELFQHGANVMAAPSGGTAIPGKKSTAASVIGGGLSGAAAGMMVGGPVGAAVGGALGMAAGFI